MKLFHFLSYMDAFFDIVHDLLFVQDIEQQEEFEINLREEVEINLSIEKEIQEQEEICKMDKEICEC